MFSFARRRTPRNPAVHKVIQRFLNAVNPDLAKFDDESRCDYRSHRTVPVLLAPHEDGISLDEACYALTKNLSVRGLALVLPQPFRAERVAVGFWFAEQAQFVSGEVRQNVPLGGGFWQLGVEVTQVLNPDDSSEVKRLLPLAVRLDPHLNCEALAAAQLVQL
ncbi:MAG TPA: PilZ domain-containing protein [Pirellulales bacterium]|nr:PilZ domain-containing protein [Pirellulales bacterium]